MNLYIILLLLCLLACDNKTTSQETKIHNPIKFKIGGNVSGLNGSILLKLNALDTIEIIQNGSFQFDSLVAEMATYEVSIISKPINQTVQLVNSSGVVTADVSSIEINCVDSVVQKQVYVENFDGGTSAEWPSPWSVVQEANSPMLDADVIEGRGRLRGTASNVARIVNRNLIMKNFEAYFTIRFENSDQGIGFYGRQNGGRLTATEPLGSGYACFVEGNGEPAIGIWYEEDGVEILAVDKKSPFGDQVALMSNTDYRVRFKVEQQDSILTKCWTKVWSLSEEEPANWQAILISNKAHLQNVADGFAFDIYNYSGTDAVYIDNILIQEL